MFTVFLALIASAGSFSTFGFCFDFSATFGEGLDSFFGCGCGEGTGDVVSTVTVGFAGPSLRFYALILHLSFC